MGGQEAAPRGSVRHGVRTLNPGYFALVMASGIVSVGMHLVRATTLSAVLLWLTAVCYVLLVAAFLWRILAFPAAVRRDFGDPVRGFGFFTFPAATDVLGTRLALDSHTSAATALLVVAGLAWLILGYAVPWTVALRERDAPVLAGANGTWFIWAVATQSVAVLTATLEPTGGSSRRTLALLAVCCWSIGCVLYGAVGVLVAARLTRYRPRPTDITPPYWVAMGATAITVLAGAKILGMPGTPAGATVHELVAGLSVVAWAFGSWLVLPLLAVGWWRHVAHRIPLRYEATWWSVVFPLGMYGAAAESLGKADHLPLLTAIGGHEIWVALAAWVVTFALMLGRLVVTVPRWSGGGSNG